MPSSAPTEAEQAAVFCSEGDELYAQGISGKWDDDEELITKALRRYENAWKLIHGGTAFPEGELISNLSQVGLLRDELSDKIEVCRKRRTGSPGLGKS